MSRALLAGKVVAPPARRGMVSRRAVIDRARKSGFRVVGVTAPPGYGKSTLLQEWAGVEDRPVAWATVDRLDDDPADLLALLALACSSISPEVAEIAAEMRGPGTTMLARSAPLLADALTRTADAFVLFIDDLHEAGSVGCQDALEIVLGGVPAGSQVVIASRHDQPHLARRRVEGRVLDIGPDGLRVDVAGARTIFTAAEVQASEDELDTVVQRCEGWPAGVFLCALVVRYGGSASSLAGNDPFVADYLYRECLATLSVSTQDFLRRTAVLDQLSAALCDAVLGTSDSAARLHELEVAHLFLVPMDRRRGWFRYHALFREFLLSELERVENGSVADLHRRAAAWLVANGLAVRAVDHLLAAGDRDGAALLVADVALPMYQEGRIAVVARWLAAIGQPAVERCARLVVVAAWMAILLGESPAAERWAATLDRLDLGDLAEDDDLIALESARCQVRAAMCVDGAKEALVSARFAVEHEPAWSPSRDQALHLLGSTLLLVGDGDGAREAFTEATAVACAVGNPDSVVLSEADLAILDIGERRWDDADRHARKAIAAIDEHHLEGYSTTGLALAAGARIAVHRGKNSQARRLLARGMRARVPSTHVLPFLAVKVRLHLAKAFAAIGDVTVAWHLVHEMDDVLRRCPDVGLLAEDVATFRAWLDGLAGAPGVPPLTPAELRLLPYLQTHLTMAEIARRLFVSRNTVSTQVGSIYRKLGVTTRGSAVDRSVALGLLGD